MGITKITTRNRHVSSNNPTKHDGEIGYNSTIDINRHDDTHCFGKNFRIVSVEIRSFLLNGDIISHYIVGR